MLWMASEQVGDGSHASSAATNGDSTVGMTLCLLRPVFIREEMMSRRDGCNHLYQASRQPKAPYRLKANG